VIGDADCFLLRGEGAAGAAIGGGELRPTRPCSICCEIDEEKGQGGAPGESREDMRDRGTRGSPGAMNFAGDARRWAGL
jgi:hypothetical protein